MNRSLSITLGLLVSSGFLVSGSKLFGQSAFAVSLITDSLLQHADAVIRFHTTSYERTTLERYSIDINYAVTILNKNGLHASELWIYYDGNSSVSNVKGSIYDKDGKIRGKLKKQDISDYASNASYTLFSDHRVKHIEPTASSFPFSIEYSYTIENKGIVGFSPWIPQRWINAAVERAELSYRTVFEHDLKFKELNYDFDFLSTVDGDKQEYSWSVNNLKAVDYETRSPNYLDFMPVVLLSPNRIEYEGTEGDFASWKSYGEWVYGLISGRDDLPESTVTLIRNLTDSIQDKRSKTRLIYEYMQDRTRYVNVSLGIGGYQPLPASVVDEKGYGDCKALSNYTKALLKCAGIEAYYTEIGTGNSHEIKFSDFASANQTNHVILCVPLEKDTVWLECTNQEIPFGYLGPSTQGRYGLLITSEGGVLARTPVHRSDLNTRIANIILNIQESGDAEFSCSILFNQDLYGELFNLLNYSEREQKEYLLRNWLVSYSKKIDGFSLLEWSEVSPSAELSVNGRIFNFASSAGSRMIFSPLFFEKDKFDSFIATDRKLPVFEPLEYAYIDTLIIEIPDNYTVQAIKENNNISNTYGRSNTEIAVEENRLRLVRTIEVRKGIYNNQYFDEIGALLGAIRDFSNSRIIIGLR